MTDWLKPFSLEHAATLLFVGIFIALVIGLGVRFRAHDRAAAISGGPATKYETRYRRSLGWAGVLFALIYQGYWLMPSRFDIYISLPLHVCDVMIILAPLSMLFNWRFALTLAYFWGIGLSSLGLFLPVETAGPDQLRFWIFWIAHVQVVSFGLYHIIVGRYRPHQRDVLFALGVSLAYLLAVLVVNEAFGLNYGYVGSGDKQPGTVAMLGDWPLRVVWMVVIAGIGFTAMWLPWKLVKGSTNRYGEI